MSSDSFTFNGKEYDPEVANAASSILRERMSENARGINPTASGGIGGADVSSDATITRWLGQQYNGDRDVHKVLGYPDLDDETALERYRARYEYQDVANRIIDVFPEDTFKDPPKIVDEGETDTGFERVANTFLHSEANAYCRRLDRAQRLGEYGVMVVGVADGQDLSKPVNESAVTSVDDITHFNIFTQENVESWELGKDTDGEHSDPSSERYNKPVTYRIDFGDVDADNQDDDFKEVHWSRVIHAAEGALETDLKGEPALKPIMYRLIDREKVVGASAEMFWSGADEKIIANVKEDFALKQYDDTGERENFKEDLHALLHDMQKYMVSTGMDYEVIGGQEVDPSGVVDTIDTAIATAIGMPKNKLRGNETGERATTEDRSNWFDIISTRQTNFAGPQIVRPLIDRLIGFGVLPEPSEGDYSVDWPSLFEQDDKEVADTRSARSSALQASGLAMTLSSEQKLAYLEEGPEGVDMSDTQEVPVDPAGETPGENEAFHDLFENVSLTPPQEVQSHAQDVLDWRDDPDKTVSGMTDTGWNRAEQLASGDALSPSDVQEIYAWFARHGPDEYELNSEGMDPWKDNGRVAIKGWGGPPMREWIAGKREALTDSGELEPVTNARRYGEGDTVDTPNGVGVVMDVLTETVESEDDVIEASEDSPTYLVLTESESDGLGRFKASELNSTEIETELENPTEELAENADHSRFDQLVALITGNQDGFFEWPQSWVDSETPARVIALKAFAGMNGSFDGCVREMRGNVTRPEAFCGDFIDRLVGNPYWRGDSPLPGA